jgi:iron-sulfur cluster repair protein YtfE (RIC family)
MATSTNVPSVVTMIRTQHELIRSLMQQVAEASPQSRGEKFEPLVRLLAVHETAEEEIVYPAVRGETSGAFQIVEARKDEEDKAKKALADLEKQDPASDEFAIAFTKLRRDVEMHATKEETEVLPLLDGSDAERLQAMGKAFAVAEAMAPTHAHRMAPESATGNMLVGPFVAMVDRVRDVIRDARQQ